METKFTKGPWATYPDDDGDYIVAIGSMAFVMPSTFSGLFTARQGDAESVANAYLISSAPDMYGEIQRDIDRIDTILLVKSGFINEPLIAERCRKVALLAKARGE
jgi:hypothetical protein